MARELGVTYGYVSQLRIGLRNVATISKTFATSCARFLGVAPAVVLLLSGYLQSRSLRASSTARHLAEL